MSKVVTVGATALFACILCATPLSLRLSPEGNVALSVDSASAEIGRPLTATSVAGVNRRVHRRAYRRGYYGNTAHTVHTSHGYGTYQRYGYGHTSRHTDHRTTAIALTNNPTMGMATGNGGSSDRAIRMIGEARWPTKPPRSNRHEHAKD